MPTTGIATAAKLVVTGAGVTALAGAGGNEYKVALNVSASPNPAAVTLTGVVKDVAGTTYTSVNSNVVKFKSYNTGQATVGLTTGVVTAVAPGVAVIEVSFPSFDNTEGIFTGTLNPKDMIYARVEVQVGV